MDDMLDTPVVILRSTGTGPVVAGVVQDAPVVKMKTYGSVQPMKGSEVLILPEGERVKKAYKLYTKDELQVANEATKQKADLVEYLGETYEVVKSERWVSDDVLFWKSLMMRKNL